jgi:hypothetical protein
VAGTVEETCKSPDQLEIPRNPITQDNGETFGVDDGWPRAARIVGIVLQQSIP